MILSVEDIKTETFTLASGRMLAYGMLGDPGGKPLLFCHGSPGSRLEIAMFAPDLLAHGYTLIAPDRPGMGISGFQSGLTWLEQAAEIGELAEHLGFAKFDVMGYSGGGTMAMACGHRLADRIGQVFLVGSWAPVYRDEALFNLVAPYDRFFYKLGKLSPALFNLLFSSFMLTARYASAKTLVNSLKSSMSDADWELMQDEAYANFIRADLKESFRQGVKGPGYDALIQYEDWGFDIEEISVPVHIVHGTEDKFAPYPFAEYLSEHIQNAALHSFEGDGHFAIHERLEQVLDSLT